MELEQPPADQALDDILGPPPPVASFGWVYDGITTRAILPAAPVWPGYRRM